MKSQREGSGGPGGATTQRRNAQQHGAEQIMIMGGIASSHDRLLKELRPLKKLARGLRCYYSLTDLLLTLCRCVAAAWLRGGFVPARLCLRLCFCSNLHCSERTPLWDDGFIMSTALASRGSKIANASIYSMQHNRMSMD